MFSDVLFNLKKQEFPLTIKHFFHSYTFQTIVEGVENGKVADIVGEMDVTLLQGYYYSRPVCRNDFEKLLEEDKNK